MYAYTVQSAQRDLNNLNAEEESKGQVELPHASNPNDNSACINRGGNLLIEEEKKEPIERRRSQAEEQKGQRGHGLLVPLKRAEKQKKPVKEEDKSQAAERVYARRRVPVRRQFLDINGQP